MKAYSLKKAKELVRAFNKTRTVQGAADAAQMPLADARAILVWLERHDRNNAHLRIDRAEFRLFMPTAGIWSQFLFRHGIGPETTAAAVNWPLARLYEKVASPAAWESEERELRLHDNAAREDLSEPSPEELAEIQARLAEVRARYDQAEQQAARVEVVQYDYDPHTGIFE